MVDINHDYSPKQEVPSSIRIINFPKGSSDFPELKNLSEFKGTYWQNEVHCPAYLSLEDAQTVAENCKKAINGIAAPLIYEGYSIFCKKMIKGAQGNLEALAEKMLRKCEGQDIIPGLKFCTASGVISQPFQGSNGTEAYFPVIQTGQMSETTAQIPKILFRLNNSDFEAFRTGRVLVDSTGKPNKIVFLGPNMLNPFWPASSGAWSFNFKGEFAEVETKQR
jgi:hypothetical protein